MKFNWGTKLAIAMAAFMIMIIIFVVLMMREDVNLVESDYYPKGQKYQEIIDKKQQSAELSDSLVTGYTDGFVTIQFPKGMNYSKITGSAHFYHRVESKFDFKTIVNPDTNGIFFYKADNLYGRYIVKTDWQYNGVSYFNENSLNIPQ
jgi:hypothetical protein